MNNTTTMENINDYRLRIKESLANARDKEGNPRLTEQQVERLAEELSDDELAEGMPFNTPDEVAELLLEAGLE